MYTIDGEYIEETAAGKCTGGPWKGWTCLQPSLNKYPVKSPSGNVDCSKVRSAAAYGSRFGQLSSLISAGLNTYRRQCDIDVKTAAKSSAGSPAKSSGQKA